MANENKDENLPKVEEGMSLDAQDEGEKSLEPAKPEGVQVTDILDLAKSFDKLSDMGGRFAQYIVDELNPGETPVFAAKTGIAINCSILSPSNVNSAAVVLTESRFFYIGTKSGFFASTFGKPTLRESVSLDEITSISFNRNKSGNGAKIPYLTISTRANTYEIELPATSRLMGGAAKQDQWNDVYNLFESTRKNFVMASNVASARLNARANAEAFGAPAAGPDPFSNWDEPQPQPQPAQKSSSGDDLEQLEKLASLRDRGIITEEEFQAKKKQILGL